MTASDFQIWDSRLQMPVCIALLETNIVDAHAFELNWSEVVVSKMQKCSSGEKRDARGDEEGQMRRWE